MPRHTARNRFDKPDDLADATVYRPFVLDLTVPYSLRMIWTGECGEDDGTASWPSTMMTFHLLVLSTGRS